MSMSVALMLIFFVLSLLGIPLALSLGLSVIATVLSFGLPITVVGRLMYTSMNSFLLVAVPLFILAGSVMGKGGVSDQIFGAANSFVSRMRGGLGHVNIIASFIFGGISGSSVADVGSLGPLEIKAMTDQGYPKDYSAALTMVTATLSSIVPPSILMIIAAVTANQSVSACLAGGFGPAIMLSGMFMIVNSYISIKKGYGKIEKISFKKILKINAYAFPSLLSPVIILFGMFSGVITPTEAAALAVVYTLLISHFFYKTLNWKELPKQIMNAGITAGTILFIAMTASVATYIFAVDQLPMKVSALILGISQNPGIVMLVFAVIFVLIGMFMDATAAILLITPVLLPTAEQIGIHPVHFVVFMVTALSIGLTTPPVGVCLFATSLVSKLKIEQLVKASVPFFICIVLFLIIYALVPGITLVPMNILT